MKTKMFRLLVLSFIAAACMHDASAEDHARTWRVEGSGSADKMVAAKVIERRFTELKPGFFDSVKSRMSGDALTLTFSGWMPTPRQAEFLATASGSFRILLESSGSDPLVTDADIVDARASISDVPQLAIRLSASAVARVAERTQNSAGKFVTVEWDGKVLARLRIAGPLRRDIALAVASLDDARLLSSVLRAGRLPPGASFMLLER